MHQISRIPRNGFRVNFEDAVRALNKIGMKLTKITLWLAKHLQMPTILS